MPGTVELYANMVYSFIYTIFIEGNMFQFYMFTCKIGA